MRFGTRALKGKVAEDLVTMGQLAHRHGGKAVDKLMDLLGVKGGNRGQFVRTAGMLPDIELGADGQSGMVMVKMTRKNRLYDREGRIYAPRFPKPQNEGYFVLITPNNGSEVLALKRAKWPNLQQRGGRGALTGTVRMKLEDAEHERRVDILLLSDSYPGMEWKILGVVVPRNEIETVQVEHDEGLDKKGKGKASMAAASAS